MKYNVLRVCELVVLFLCLSSTDVLANVSYGRPNIALGGTIISNSPAVLGSAAGINDGLLTTILYSYIQNPSDGRYYCEFVLDLGKSYTMDQIDLYIAQTRGFTLSVSDDNANWTVLQTREWTAFVSTAVSIPFNQSIGGRYIKYYGWASWNQYVGVVEITVYEKGSVPIVSPIGFLGTDNIAKDKPITHVVGDAELNHPLANIVDGDTSTSWIVKTPSIDDETGYKTYAGGMVIDLGKEITIGKVVVKTNKYHSHVISFPAEISEFWGEKWSFSSTPDLFASDDTGSGEIVFDLKGLVTARYISLLTQTIGVTDSQPEITEFEVYAWEDDAGRLFPWAMFLPAINNGRKE